MRTELNYENAIFWASQQHELLRQQATLEVRITALEYEVDRREKDVLGAVTSEKEEGKPKYGNELARKAEVAARLSIDPDYQRAQAELAILNKESMHLQREAKYAGKIVDIMCTFAQKGQEPMIPVPASLLATMGGREDPRKVAVGIPGIDELTGGEDRDERFPAA